MATAGPVPILSYSFLIYSILLLIEYGAISHKCRHTYRNNKNRKGYGETVDNISSPRGTPFKILPSLQVCRLLFGVGHNALDFALPLKGAHGGRNTLHALLRFDDLSIRGVQ